MGAMRKAPRVCVGAPSPFHVFDLARELEKRGNLELLLSGYPRSRVTGIARERVATFPWLMAPRMLLARRGMTGLADRLDPLVHGSFERWAARSLPSCDVFHCMSGFGLTAFRRAKELGAVTVCDRASTHIEVQDQLLRDEFDRWGAEYRGIDRRVIQKELMEYEEADLIFVPSEVVRQTFRDRGVAEEKVVKIALGVDTSIFSKIPDVQDPGFTVLFVGTLGIRKGLGYLLEAIAQISDIPDLRLRLVGPVGKAGRDLLARAPVSFEAPGAVPSARLREEFSRASVFVMPSVEEGFGLVIAQAMACGLPVVASESCGAAELIDDGIEGYVVAARDPEVLSDRIRYLHRNPEIREQMGIHAQERTVRGWSAYAQEVVDNYEAKLSR